MDMSEIDIKMCDCPEIQNEWSRCIQVFDLCFVKPLKYTQHVLMKWESDVGIVVYFGQGHRYFSLKECIWLPRQDQLQKMVNAHYQKHLKILYEFSLKVSWSIQTMEQLWLAFVMHELHSKEWDGEKWVAKPSREDG